MGFSFANFSVAQQGNTRESSIGDTEMEKGTDTLRAHDSYTCSVVVVMFLITDAFKNGSYVEKECKY